MFSKRARVLAAIFFFFSPVGPNCFAQARVRPTSPPICSVNPLLVNPGLPIKKNSPLTCFFLSLFLVSCASELLRGGCLAHPAAELFVEPPFRSFRYADKKKKLHFPAFSPRSRGLASTRCCLSPLGASLLSAALRPAPPPSCSLNPLGVSAATPIDEVLCLSSVFSTPARMHASASCWSRPVRPIRRSTAVSLPAPPPMRHCR